MNDPVNNPVDMMESRAAMLDAIHILQQDFLKKGIAFGWCDRVLESLLHLSGSEFGFICELLHQEDGTPFIKSHSITNIAWDDTTRAFFQEHVEQGLDFFNFNSLWGHAITSGAPVIANDPDNDPRRGGYPKAEGHPSLRAFLGLPIKSAAGEVLGVMGLANRPGGYSRDDAGFLELFTNNYGMMIELDREREARHKLGAELIVSQRRFRHLVENLSCEYCLYAHDTQGVMTYVSPSITGMLGWAPDELMASYQQVLTDNPHNLEVAQKMAAALAGERQAPYLVEMRHKDGSTRWVELSEWPVFDEAGAVTGLEGLAHDVTARQKAEAQVWRQANYDRLTGLPNRTLFFDRLSRAIVQARRDSRYLAVLYFDLDNFKPINDRHGHEAGDKTLACIAQRWLESIRSVDTLARMGGDEFALIVGDLGHPDLVEPIAQKLIDALEADVVISPGIEHKVGVSVGIATYPNNALEMDSLLSAADEAMYLSKQHGRNRYSYSARVSTSGQGSPEWIRLDDEFIVGVPEIDAQHERLVRLVNQLNIDILGDPDSASIPKQFEELIACTNLHFETEHHLMAQSKYPGMAKHDMEHESLLETVMHMAKPPYKDKSLLILQTIKDWLIQHIHVADKELGEYLRQRRT